jgi:hypothetical protein
MAEESTLERQRVEIRGHINALLGLVERLPESRDEAIELLEKLEKKIRVMQKVETPPEAEDETYIGT